MKKILTLLAALALAASVQAQNNYAHSIDDASLVSYKITLATTVATNLTREPFRLSAPPGGQSILAWGGTSLCGTNAVQTNAVTVTLATSIGLGPTDGPWFTNATIRFDNNVGTNGLFTLGETNLGPAKWARIVKLAVAGTNTAAAAGSTVTLRLGQHRPY